MKTDSKVLIVQTAFLGDLILTIPLIQKLKEYYSQTKIDILCLPGVSDVLKNNPDINKIISYDKKNLQKGLLNFLKVLRVIKSEKYDIVISPHRSFRSAVISFFSGSQKRISFDKSSLKYLYTDNIIYNKSLHEIQRNLSLLEPLGIHETSIVKPHLYTSDIDSNSLMKLINNFKFSSSKSVVIAPGSVWFTKKYPSNKFINLLNILITENITVFLIGGKDDVNLCLDIEIKVNSRLIKNLAGKLSILQSASLIEKCGLLITNDSAPLHLGNAVGSKVYAIFGATVPEFGFFPYGKFDRIFQIKGLKCRPCAIHGGNTCPIGTFDCMNSLDEKIIADEIIRAI